MASSELLISNRPHGAACGLPRSTRDRATRTGRHVRDPLRLHTAFRHSLTVHLHSTTTSSMGLIDFIVNWLTRLVIYILSAGPVPQHVAFVMDGNRRYARHKQVEVSEGHVDGFGALKRVSRLKYCVPKY
jgi:hypothetical protein